MKVYDSNMLRNIAVLGHSGCGKTNLIEAIAYTSNLTNKISKQNDKVNMTYTLGLVLVEYNNYKYNLLDTPGYFDFCGEVISSLTCKRCSYNCNRCYYRYSSWDRKVFRVN